MLTALFDDTKIFSLDAIWVNKREEINASAVCPQCHESILCKFGDINIHHFAHTTKANCPGSKDNAEHMRGMELLYTYLKNYYKDSAEIDIEHQFENGIISDFLIFENGRKTVIEFYAGHLKDKELKKKILYYQENSIPVIWFVSISNLELLPDYSRRIKRTAMLLTVDTDFEKYYDRQIYETYFKLQRFVKLETGQTLGTLNIFDIKENKIFIARAIRPAGHLRTYEIGKLIRIGLDDLKISLKKAVVFSEEEIAWFRKCKQLDDTLAIEAEARAKANIEAEAKSRAEAKAREDARRANKSANYQSSFSINNAKCSFYAASNTKANLNTGGMFLCTKCNGSFAYADMSNRILVDLRRGWCKSCAPQV